MGGIWLLVSGSMKLPFLLSKSMLTRPNRRPEDVPNTKDTLKYYINLAKLAERGKISAIFFADWYAGFDVYGGSMDAMLNASH